LFVTCDKRGGNVKSLWICVCVCVCGWVLLHFCFGGCGMGKNCLPFESQSGSYLACRKTRDS